MGYLLANIKGHFEGRISDDLYSNLDFSNARNFEVDSKLSPLSRHFV